MLNATRIITVTDLYLGNNSREGKIRFYESKGDNGVKICLRKYMASGSVALIIGSTISTPYIS